MAHPQTQPIRRSKDAQVFLLSRPAAASGITARGACHGVAHVPASALLGYDPVTAWSAGVCERSKKRTGPRFRTPGVSSHVNSIVALEKQRQSARIVKSRRQLSHGSQPQPRATSHVQPEPSPATAGHRPQATAPSRPRAEVLPRSVDVSHTEPRAEPISKYE